MSNLTIGAIWRNKKTGKEYELVAVNRETNKVQLAANGNGDKDGYKCMTENSLRKNYTLTALKSEKKPDVVAVVDKSIPQGEEAVSPKPVATKRGIGRVELADGRVVRGIHFLNEIAHAEGKLPSEPIWWLRNTKAGQVLLEQFNAEIVYGKPLSELVRK